MNNITTPAATYEIMFLLDRMTPTTLVAMYADLHECECDNFAQAMDRMIRKQLANLIGDEEAAEELDAVLNGHEIDPVDELLMVTIFGEVPA